MKWLEKIFGSSDHRRYGDDEYYEYPRNSVCDSSQSSSGSWQSDYSSSSGSWRGPSIFEDPYADMYQDTYPTRGIRNVYQESRNSYQDEIYLRDTSKYVSQYGGTTEFYNPANGRYRESSYSSNKEPSPYTNRRFKTEDYDRSEVALQQLISLQYPAPYAAPIVAPILNPIMATAPRLVGMSTCAGCHQTLGFGKFLTCLNQNWHPSCFNCRDCRKQIIEKEFSVQGNDPYHRDCYKKLFHPKCEICYNFIPLNLQGQMEYRSHPFWNQKYCPSHERDGSRRCCSCDRLEAVDERYRSMGDGRWLCSECHESALMATKECQPLYRDILKFYKHLGMPIEQEVPMLLVERDALNNARETEKDGHTHAPETRGLCLSEEQTIPTVFGTGAEDHVGYSVHHGMEMRKLTHHCEVTAILVLNGLPRLLTGSILVHELMHAWIRLDGRFPNLENDIEEGICQVIAHMWLKSELDKLPKRNWSGCSISKRLGEFFINQIETDSSPIYGDGFRRAFAAVSAYGLVQTLHILRQTGDIPR